MSEHSSLISVAVPTPIRKTFQYCIAPKDAKVVQPGCRVVVPFSGREVIGIVTSLDAVPDIDLQKIRSVIRVIDDKPVVPKSIFELCLRAARYYQHPPGEVFAAALPALIRSAKDPEETQRVLAPTAMGKTCHLEELNRAPAQKQTLEYIRRLVVERSQLADHGIKPDIARALIKRGYACWSKPEVVDSTTFDPGATNYAGLSPTDEQQDAISAIEKPGTYLLQGITGSGKTEVYLRVIERMLIAGRQAIVLVPEIGLTPQTITRFASRFKAPLAVIHSSLTDRERALSFLAAREGRAAIVLGTRSAIFTPLKAPGVIIVDEEHDVSFKQQDGFRYSARDLAVLRGQIESVPVILGSATPSLESLHNAAAGRYKLCRLTQRPAGAIPEQYHIIDARHCDPVTGFAPPLIHMMNEELGKGQQVLLFINRRGYAPVLLCNECEAIASCHRCDARLTFHLSQSLLICHHCGTTARMTHQCPTCRSPHVVAVGRGTQRIEASLKNLFPSFPILRIDSDSIRKKGAMQDFMGDIATGNPAILVGTQLLAKGHHFPDVTLVALLDIDGGFYSSDFKALERMGQLILQVGGRAGRVDKPGMVVIQTQFSGHPLLAKLINEGYTSFATQLLADREKTGLPPFAYHALVRAESIKPDDARVFLEQLAVDPSERDSVEMLGPIPALIEKKAGRFRAMLLLSSTSRADLHHVVTGRIARAEKLPAARKVRWAVDVDPNDLF